MNKFEKVRAQFPSVTEGTTRKLYNEDFTASKKYFPYMVQLWNDKKKNMEMFTASQLLRVIQEFENLTPYLENKDIYSQEYSSYVKLKKAIFQAEQIKEEKTFKREEHIEVWDETDDYILLSPLTHRGSLKYGSGTRWCTASKYDEHTFNRYNKNGFLAYLIDKKAEKPTNYSKLAFWTEEINSAISGEIMIYSSNDDYIDDKKVLDSGWSLDLWFKLNMLVRQKAFTKFRTKQAESNVKKKLTIINNINFEQLQEDIRLLQMTRNSLTPFSELAIEFESVISNFTNQLKNQLEQQNG